MRIASRLHHLAENVLYGTGESAGDHPVIKRMLSAPNYVADSEVLELIQKGGVSKSIEALCEAELAHLPYPSMVLELELVPGIHNAIMFEEAGDNKISITWAMLELADRVGFLCNQNIYIYIEKGGFRFEDVPQVPITRDLMIGSIVAGLSVALLMLNTKGIEKEVVDCERLNKKRIKSGKIPIQKHHILHIGTIYNRKGDGVKRGETGGWKMPMHMRAAHTRTQRIGKGREDSKIVYIPPTIVNFDPEGEVRQPKKIIRI